MSVKPKLLVEVDAALKENEARRSETADSLAVMPEAIAAALEDETLDRAKRLRDRQSELELLLLKTDRVRATLEGRRARLVAERRQELIAEHLQAAKVAFSKLQGALATAVEANVSAGLIYQDAERDLGGEARSLIPRISFMHLNDEALALWVQTIRQSLDNQPVAESPTGGVRVKITAPFARASGAGCAAIYVAGDVVVFAAEEARRLIGRNEAELVAGETIRPKLLPQLITDVDGCCLVAFVRAARGPDGASYGATDVARFPRDVAAKFVRSGAAEPLAAPSVASQQIAPQEVAPKKEVLHAHDR